MMVMGCNMGRIDTYDVGAVMSWELDPYATPCCQVSGLEPFQGIARG